MEGGLCSKRPAAPPKAYRARLSDYMSQAAIPLWLDCDPGHDDAFAILIAAHHPSLNLLGITTIHGNASLANTTANAASILEAFGRPEIPVLPGANKPFCRPAVHAPDIHGVSGLDGTALLPQASQPPITDKNPILAMRDALLAQPPDTAWVVATGTLTNIALLFTTFPDVARHIKGLSIMGSAIGEGFTDVPMSRLPGEEARIGNMTPWAEFNIYCDPEASQSILSNPVLAPKTTLIGLDLTHQVLATRSVQERVLGARIGELAKNDLRQMLHELLLFFAGTYSAVFGIDEGPPLHDPVAVAVVLSSLNPEYAQSNPASAIKFNDRDGERFLVNVVTDGQHGDTVAATGQLGRTIAKPVKGKGVAIPRGMDTDSFWDLLISCLERAEKGSPLVKSAPQ
ncbi:hypothetical protein PISL3812_02794 [Talaromyces islandicus]|uniref:Inosine/uridine-preferring nucleoside hydrolase domain-containing protein n=1 Tax=Talaromyces islandicus TaxID=28573 RepID=A0A0U1LRL9_TALIS|nr:hypothetical protein PISL3812_02794 [Talaromyces islandicus]